MDGWNGGGMNEWVRGGEEFGFVAMNGEWIHGRREVERGGGEGDLLDRAGRQVYY